MKHEFIEVKIRKGDRLYFSESTDLPGLKLASRLREDLLEEIAAVIKYEYQSKGRVVEVELLDSNDPEFTRWKITEMLEHACG